MIDMLLGDTRGQPPEEGERNGSDPYVDVVRVTTESEAFLSFLDDWPAWQAWLRKEAQNPAEADSQQPPK